MPDVLTDLTSERLAVAVKANLYAFFRTLDRVPSAEVDEIPVGFRWHTRVAHPWFNGVLCTQRAGADSVGQVLAAVDHFAARQVTGFTWWLDPGIPSEAWRDSLLAHGFVYDENTPGMAVDLAHLSQSTAALPDFLVRQVEDIPTLEVWTQVFMLGYGLPDAWAPQIQDLFVPLGFDGELRHYLAFVDGEPVATASLLMAAGVAGIYNVATLAEYRGRGIGAAVTLAPLLAARDLGYRVGILQSSSMGYSVYQRMGFRTVCAMEHFFWSPDRSADH